MKYIKYYESITDTYIPCAIYNVNKKELVGIFYSQKLAAKFIYAHKLMHDGNRVAYSIQNKSVISPKNSVLDYSVTVRNANPAQREELGIEKYVLRDGYIAPPGFIGSSTFPGQK